MNRVLPHCRIELTDMKLYKNLDVNLSYQNFGSTWVLVLRGKTEDIELAVNGLYNWGATNGDCEYYDHTQTVGVIWTDKPSLLKFFESQARNQLLVDIPFDKDKANRHYRKCLAFNINVASKELARQRIEELQHQHENFFRFANGQMPETYGTGTIGAERPDNDMKDAILSHAFENREVTS